MARLHVAKPRFSPGYWQAHGDVVIFRRELAHDLGEHAA
jgi:hypothetical protein